MPTNPTDLTKSLYLSKDIEDAVLIATLSSVIEILPDEILLTREENWWQIERGEQQLVCHAELHGGDFPLWFNLYKYGGNAKLPHADADVATLCRLLGASCLVEDMDNKNPYSWLLITPDRIITTVHNDPEREEYGELVIIDL